MSLLKEFKEFALKGNVFDMAVGIIIGAGFAKITGSFTNDIMMPPLGLLLGKVDFKEIKLVLQKAATDGTSEVAINIGMFLQYTFDFIILAFAVFLLVKAYNKLKQQEPAPAPPAPPAPSNEEVLLSEIRDLLKKQQAK